MLKWNFALLLLSLSAPYAALVGVSGGNHRALDFPVTPETVFVKISKANKPRLSIEKGPRVSISPNRFEDACSLEGTNLRVDLSGIVHMHATTLRIPIKAFVIFLTEHQEFPLSPEEEAHQMDVISDDGEE